MTSPIRSFSFDENVVDYYTRGGCWYLCLALMERTGLEPVALWAKGKIYHVGVKLPGGDIVDIDGVWQSDAWAAFWQREFESHPVEVAPTSHHDEYWRTSHNLWASYQKDFLLEGPRPLQEIIEIIVSILERYELIPSK